MSGDCNTKYFHWAATIRGQNNKVTRLLNDVGTWISDSNKVRDLVTNYYDKLYKDEGREVNFIQDNNFPQLSFGSLENLLTLSWHGCRA